MGEGGATSKVETVDAALVSGFCHGCWLFVADKVVRWYLSREREEESTKKMMMMKEESGKCQD